MKTHKHYHNHSLLNGGKDVWILSSNWALVCNNVRETIASSLTCIFMQTFVQQFRIGLFLLSKPRCSVCDAPSWPGRLWTDQLARLQHIASMYWKGADNIFVLASWYTSLFSWEKWMSLCVCDEPETCFPLWDRKYQHSFNNLMFQPHDKQIQGNKTQLVLFFFFLKKDAVVCAPRVKIT